MITLIDVKTAFDKNSTPILGKNSQNTQKRQNFLKLINNICKKKKKNPVINIMLNGERLDAFPPKTGIKASMSVLNIHST